MSLEAMKQALEALELWGELAPQYWDESDEELIAALCIAIEQAEKQEPVAVPVGYWHKGTGAFFQGGYLTPAQEQMRKSGVIKPLYPTPPQRQPLTDAVRQMRDVQGRDGTWNYDPYMHGLYNGLEFAVSLLEQREPQFKDAPEKWLCDLPKPRIVSSAHGIGGEHE
jgi:hypothetical protein